MSRGNIVAFLLVAATWGPHLAAAQGPGQLAGTLLDQRTRQPLPFANVVLLRLPDSTLVASAQTTENGAFVLAELAPSTYLLRAEALGYQSARRVVAVAAGARGCVWARGCWRRRPCGSAAWWCRAKRRRWSTSWVKSSSTWTRTSTAWAARRPMCSRKYHPWP
ncbi:carboxypeptidase-like regulatory domain-containing protein [Hymenobacter coccineus]|uniref:carboxypeptidase-like regulatory domain-containing protein n=1 Tax=Hymenobacter coccineus TaxID=1908235 RepID=UPI0013018808|nr:carboxypeptidase-like regulatory domain-containing protein [Hymenobacter coccineus]